MRINKHVSYSTKMIWVFRNSEPRSWHNNFFWGVHSPTAPEICTYLVSLYNLLLIGSDGFELYKYRNLSKARERDCAVLWNCQLSSGYEDFRFSNTCTTSSCTQVRNSRQQQWCCTNLVVEYCPQWKKYILVTKLAALITMVQWVWSFEPQKCLKYHSEGKSIHYQILEGQFSMFIS